MNAASKLKPERSAGNGAGASPSLGAKNPHGVYHRILWAADFSSDSKPVFKQALQLARQNNAELLILHSYDLPKTVGFMPADCYDEWVTDYRAQAALQARAFVNQARAEGVRCHFLVCNGYPEDTIGRAVTRAKIDLVVIGTHARRGLLRFLSPSVASRIIPRANCPVLTVRRHDENDP